MFRQRLKSDASKPDPRPPLLTVQFPNVTADLQHSLSTQGWTAVSLPVGSLLRTTLDALLMQAMLFFALPPERKASFAPIPRRRSEPMDLDWDEGWSRLGSGRGESLALRTVAGTPTEMRAAARTAWAESARQLDRMLGLAAESLGLPATSFTRFSTPCRELDGRRTATVLRLFRHEDDPAAAAVAARVASSVADEAAQADHDAGLLTLVYSDGPGLEVWDLHRQTFRSTEDTLGTLGEAGAAATDVGAKHHATVFAGRQLERLSNQRYPTGGRRRRVSPPTQIHPSTSFSRSHPSLGQSAFRYSVALEMHAHMPVPVDTGKLTTHITGPFRFAMRGGSTGVMNRQIKAAKFDPVTGLEVN